jgi:hypothetical protein
MYHVGRSASVWRVNRTPHVSALGNRRDEGMRPTRFIDPTVPRCRTVQRTQDNCQDHVIAALIYYFVFTGNLLLTTPIRWRNRAEMSKKMSIRVSDLCIGEMDAADGSASS